MIRRALAATLALLIFAAPAWADSNISVEDAWAPPTPGGAKTAAIYLTLVNRGTRPDRVIGVQSPLANRADLHTTIRDGDGDVMRMRHVISVDIPAGGKASFAPNGIHIMLTGLKAPLKMGDAVPVSLKLAESGEISAVATVRR